MQRRAECADYYVTPVPDIELFLREFDKRVDVDWSNTKILDPCAGGNPEIADRHGNIIEARHEMSYPTAIKNVFGTDVDTIDIRENSLASVKENYLESSVHGYQIIITNPPFNNIVEIIDKAMNDVEIGGYVIMLLRLNFFGSQSREEFFNTYFPEWCFVHRKRMSFLDKKMNGFVEFDADGNPKKAGTDSIEYCHMVFHKGLKPEYAKLVVI